MTAIRRGRAVDRDRLGRTALDLVIDAPRLIDTIACPELRGVVYEIVANWDLA